MRVKCNGQQGAIAATPTSRCRQQSLLRQIRAHNCLLSTFAFIAEETCKLLRISELQALVSDRIQQVKKTNTLKFPYLKN